MAEGLSLSLWVVSLLGSLGVSGEVEICHEHGHVGQQLPQKEGGEAFKQGDVGDWLSAFATLVDIERV